MHEEMGFFPPNQDSTPPRPQLGRCVIGARDWESYFDPPLKETRLLAIVSFTILVWICGRTKALLDSRTV